MRGSERERERERESYQYPERGDQRKELGW